MLGILLSADLMSPYNLIIVSSIIIIVSFIFGEFSKKTNIPAVLMLIFLGILIKIGLQALGLENLDFFPILEVLGIVGLIMIVLEAALELELKREKLIPIAKAFLIALVGLLVSIWVAANILNYFIPDMDMKAAWIYATPLSILSSAIIIPSVSGLNEQKKEFHIYESTFSDILGIMVFYFLTGQMETGEGNGIGAYMFNVLLTIVISFIASYLIVLIFQKIKSHTKLFLLIAVLLLLYSIGKLMHLSSLIIILIFGLLIANIELFFEGKIGKWLHREKAKEMYEGLHIITIETAFVVRTFFFVIFGITIVLADLASFRVAMISALIIASIYLIRYLLLLPFMGKDLIPQLYIAPRGLITVLLFYAIPPQAKVESFEPGILLFIIIVTGVIMTIAMVYDKQRTTRAIHKAKSNPIGYEEWTAPTIESISEHKDKNQ